MTIVLVLLSLACITARSTQRNCTEDDFVYEYTTCRSDGSRWRVAVPKKEGTCFGGVNPPPTRKGKPCDFSCGSGEYFQTQGDEECHKCPAGTYSLGGQLLFDSWHKLPKEFTIHSEKLERGDAFGSSVSEDVNCTRSRWYPHGDYIAVSRGNCLSNLVLHVNLLHSGSLTVKYSYHGFYESSLRVKIQNDRCMRNEFGQDSSEKRYSLLSSDTDSWRERVIHLLSGGNTITWEASSYLYGPSSYSNTRTAAKIKSIEVTGIAYASTCTACPAGSFSKSGASKCEWCPDDFYAPNEGMSECLPCNISTHFSKAGATKCIERPACQESDYFVTHTPCDNNGQTQLMYKWVDPKVCRDGYSESIKLPPSGRPEKCPPCNPGMASTNMTDHRCVVCPRGHYSDGSHPCIKCPPVTEAVYNIDLQFWPNSDSLPHFVTLDCVSDAPGYCVDSGWEFLSNFIGTNLHNNPTAVPQLTIHTIGFRGSESVVTGGEMSIVGHVRFVFETECEHKCEFRFLVQEDTEDAVEVLSWTGSQPKQESSYLVKSTAPAKFIWTFRKVGKDQIKHKMGSFGHFPQTSLVHDSTSRVNIHSINITNTVNGGASYCRGCLTKAKISNQEIARCESCPKGHYVDTNTRECVPCPQNTRLNENYPIGLNSCVACGPGTISLGDQLLAVVTSEESSNLSAMSVIGDIRKGNESILNFFFKGIGATALCPKGRSAVVALHCDVTKGGQGELTLPLHCPDGTCDGCTYGFVWHTQVACPLCRDSDYEKLEGVCKDNKSEIMYLQKEPRECIGGVTRPRKVKVDCVEQRMVVVTVVEHKPVASLLDYKGYIGIALGVAVILVLVLIFLYFKNRRLEYKYQQLKQSAKDGDELPAPETCVQESEDEDEVVYRKGIKTERKLLKKLKGITGKGKDIEMEEMDFQTVQLGSTFENA